MKPLLQSNRKNKKAISNMVAYALLISMTLILSIFVGNWLRFYVEEDGPKECPENMAVAIANYTCVKGPDGYFNASIKNTGLFKVDGFYARVTDEPNAKFADMGNWQVDVELLPGEISDVDALIFRNTDSVFDHIVTEISLVELQPFIKTNNNEKILCSQITKQRIECKA